MSASAIRFKGKGWYVTDYAAKGKQTDAGEEKKASSSDAAPAVEKPAGDTQKSKDTTTAKKPAPSESAPTSKSSGGS